MNDQLETELREVFALRATDVTSDAEERLRRVDYRPRTRRRWPLTVSGLGLASGTAAIVSVVVFGGSQAAFAGWSATPSAPTPAQTAVTQNDCQGNLSTMPLGANQTWTQVATDVRGPFTVAIFQAGTSFATCFTGPSFTVAMFNAANRGQMSVAASGSTPPSGSGSSQVGVYAPGGGIDQMVVSHLALPGEGPYTLVEGRLDPAISAVTLDLSNDQDVTATTVSGWFVAWWPGSQNATAAQITSPSGTTTEPLTNLPNQLPTPPPPSANGASSSGAPTMSSGTNGP
jgi:hypothetical protein